MTTRYYTTYETPDIGTLIFTSYGDTLVSVLMKGQRLFDYHMPKDAVQNDDLEVFAKTASWFDRYFAGEQPSPKELPLDPSGATEFRKQVWDALCEIPYGQTATYKEIGDKVAKRTGKKISYRATGGAVGHNPIGIIIPCHRVVGTNGSLTGYDGGIKRKVALLELEGADMSKFFVPTKGTAL